MRIIQFETKHEGRRLGVVDGEVVRDVTALDSGITRVMDAFDAAQARSQSLVEFLQPYAENASAPEIPYAELLAAHRLDKEPVLHPPLDHAEPSRLSITGTGLTHLGSMETRDQMHAALAAEAEESKSDSKKMFELGLRGGKPEPGVRGAAPEWFYKGGGFNLRGPNQSLELPGYALDGGEEPEIVGCYVIDAKGTPRRLGFALGNEWSDHATENINYLYLAPSKLRTCAVGPELVTDCDFQHIELRCTVSRNGEKIYDSGPLLSGERHMCHSLANCEDHHFKYAQHRIPGDVHLHYFGTSKLSHGERQWKYADGDQIRIEAPKFSAALVNTVRADGGKDPVPFRVEPA